MLKFFWFVILFTAMPLATFAQDMPDNVLKIAKERYVRLVEPGVMGSDRNNPHPPETSGCRVGGKYVLTNFHARIPDHDLVFDEKRVEDVKSDSGHDLLLIK